ncbi:hypothetical protein LCGC14_1579090 [marine sediment metagenome]|uniref:Uncharacterized protein n=1 Tax=marine sediment metagenome TaxID=412755 RepID=A0A0F9IHK1_9ZZZZ
MKSKPNKRYAGRPNYTGPKSGYFLLPFHNTLVAWMPDIFKRLDTIDRTKPTKEIPWRRHCIVYVRPGELPPGIVKPQPDAPYEKRWADDYYRALKDHAKPLLQLLDKYVPDHTWNGEELVFK